MAQSVEHVIGNDEVISSILITSSNPERKRVRDFAFFKKQLTNSENYDKIQCNMITL